MVKADKFRKRYARGSASAALGGGGGLWAPLLGKTVGFGESLGV